MNAANVSKLSQKCNTAEHTQGINQTNAVNVKKISQTCSKGITGVSVVVKDLAVYESKLQSDLI